MILDLFLRDIAKIDKQCNTISTKLRPNGKNTGQIT